VAEQVVGRADEHGRSHALQELDAESVTPSVGLLQELLALKGRPAAGSAGPAAAAGRPRRPRADLQPAALSGGGVARPWWRPGQPIVEAPGWP
jgi:hypothetical protein